MSEFEVTVIDRVTDPVVGIPRRYKFLPSLAEIADECNATARSLKVESDMRARGYVWKPKPGTTFLDFEGEWEKVDNGR